MNEEWTAVVMMVIVMYIMMIQTQLEIQEIQNMNISTDDNLFW